MATDIDALRAGLEAYHASLIRHLARLTEDFATLQSCWLALDEEYAGHAAEEFRQRWAVTADWFAQYLEALHNLASMLENRSQHLHEA
jgi:hypothetical protein